MSNYIKVNIVNPGDDLPLKKGTYDATSTPPISDTNVFTLGTGWQGTPGASAAVDVSGGSGTQATAYIQTSGTPAVISDIVIESGGSNYKVGDTLTITIPTDDSINESGSAIDTVIVLTADMLQEVTEGQFLIDANQLIAVRPPKSEDLKVQYWTNLSEPSGKRFRYEIEFEFDENTVYDMAVSMAEAQRLAFQNENSQPTLQSGDATVIGCKLVTDDPEN